MCPAVAPAHFVKCSVSVGAVYRLHDSMGAVESDAICHSRFPRPCQFFGLAHNWRNRDGSSPITSAFNRFMFPLALFGHVKEFDVPRVEPENMSNECIRGHRITAGHHEIVAQHLVRLPIIVFLVLQPAESVDHADVRRMERGQVGL